MSRTEKQKRSREKTKKQWQSSNSRFAIVQTSDGACIHRHAAFICVAYTRERDGSKNLTQSVNTAQRLSYNFMFFEAIFITFCVQPSVLVSRYTLYHIFSCLKFHLPIKSPDVTIFEKQCWTKIMKGMCFVKNWEVCKMKDACTFP